MGVASHRLALWALSLMVANVGISSARVCIGMVEQIGRGKESLSHLHEGLFTKKACNNTILLPRSGSDIVFFHPYHFHCAPDNQYLRSQYYMKNLQRLEPPPLFLLARQKLRKSTVRQHTTALLHIAPDRITLPFIDQAVSQRLNQDIGTGAVL